MRQSLLVVLTMAVLVGCGGPGDDPLAAGRSVYGDVCSACHGDTGEGGVGPSLSTVLETWPSCEDHIEWVRLGSDGWKAAHGDTYGASGKPVEGGMPPQGGSLTDDEIEAVSAFERVRFGGAEREATLEECGLTDAG